MTYYYYVSYVTDEGGYGCAELVLSDEITRWSNIISIQEKLVEDLPNIGLVGNQVIPLYWTLLRTEEL